MSGPGWNNQVVAQVLIAGTIPGLLVYNPSIGAGNLMASVAGEDTFDPYGNLVLAGISSYAGNSAGDLYAELDVGKLILGLIGGVSSQIGTDPDGNVNVIPSGVFNVLGTMLAMAGTPSDPTLIETDTWHYPVLNSPFESQSGWQKMGYKLMEDNTVALSGVLNLSTGSSWAGTIWTLDAPYVPASKSGFAVGVFGAAGDGAPYLSVDTSGNVALTAVPASVTAVVIGGRIPLDGTND